MGMVVKERKRLWRDDLWDSLDILFEDSTPAPEGSEITLPETVTTIDYDYDGGFTDEEIFD